MLNRLPTLTPAERRIRRENRSAAIRAQALALRQSGATYAAIGAALGGYSVEYVRRIVGNAERLTNSPRWYDPLPMRAQTFLHNSDLAELPEVEAAVAVSQLSRRELLSHPNVGKGAVAALTDWLAQSGFSLRKEPIARAQQQQRIGA